jgi:hypothetical protein
MKGIGSLLAVPLVFWAIWGCNGSPQKTLVPVRGKLTVDGKPAVGAIVTLHPAVDDPQAVRPTGQTRADGEFELTSYYSGDGAAPGEYRVTVTWLQPQPPRSQGEGDDLPPRSLLPALYSNPGTTPLRVTIPPDKEPLVIDIKRR